MAPEKGVCPEDEVYVHSNIKTYQCSPALKILLCRGG